MENVSNISSEEKLLALRDEGKISEAEYQELLIAMRNSPHNSTVESATGARIAPRTGGHG